MPLILAAGDDLQALVWCAVALIVATGVMYASDFLNPARRRQRSGTVESTPLPTSRRAEDLAA